MTNRITDRQFAEYLRNQHLHRIQAVDRAMSVLTDYEQELVKEAAVLGYVLGAFDNASVKADVPADGVIVFRTITAALANPDLYPTLSVTPPQEDTP